MKEICRFIWCRLAEVFSDPSCFTTKIHIFFTKSVCFWWTTEASLYHGSLVTLLLSSAVRIFVSSRKHMHLARPCSGRDTWNSGNNELKRQIPFCFTKSHSGKYFSIMQKVVVFSLLALLIFMVFWVISHLKFLFFPPQATIPKSIIFILFLTGFLNDCFGVWLYLPGVSYLGISKLAHITYKLARTIIQH